jgi:tetratricopeptide (TPR) repeat protein
MTRARRNRTPPAPGRASSASAASTVSPGSPASRAGPPAPGRRGISALLRHPALGSALLGFLVYVPGLSGGFLRDDHFLIERHPYLHAAGWLSRLLTSDFWAPVSGATGMWRPLVVLSYWTDGHLGGWAPFWFHVVNALAHAGVCAALACLVLAAGGPRMAAWIAGLAFAVMPAHAECVAWISGRTDVFCALFGVAALWLDTRARSAGRSWPGVLPLLALALALLSKEAGVTLGLVLAVMEWTRMRELRSTVARSALWLLPYVAITVLFLVAHQAFAPDPGMISAPEAQGRAALRGAAWALFPGYLAYLWPWFPHSPDRAAPAFAATPAHETAIGAALVLAVLVWFARWLRMRSPRAVPLALILFPLVPPLVLASTRGYGLYGERHIYVSSAGVAWALGLALAGLSVRLGRSPRRHIVTVLAALFVVGSAVETLRALPAYRSDEAMYRTMTDREPENPMGFVGLAAVLTEHGALDESRALLARAEALDPTLPSIAVGRARVATQSGAWDTVLRESERALAIDPGLMTAQLLRAVALLHTRRLDEAGRILEPLRRQYPGHPEVGTVWGQYLLATGRNAEALPVLESAVALLPGEPSLWDAIGVANLRLGRRREARAAFERTVALAPGYLDGWLRLAGACQMLGDPAGREQALARAALLPGGVERVAAFHRAIGAGAP